MKALILYLAITITLCSGCVQNTDKKQEISHPQVNEYTTYAQKFSLEKIGEYYLVSVFDPWQNAEHSEFSYLLGESRENVPDSLNKFQFIKTPVQRVVLMSTTFISQIDALNELKSVSGISGTQYVYNEELRKRIENKEVKDVGYDQGLNYELIVDMDPDVLFLYGVEAGVSQVISKLEDLGVPVVICADYLENDPLGRAEWLKFFSLFYNKYRLADEIFEGISQRYDSICNIATGLDHSPAIFVGLPWKDTWYIAGGQSFAAQFINDAGGRYIWEDLRTTEAVPHDLESVYSRILDADIWINAGEAASLQSILDHDIRFRHLTAFENRSIYNNNKRISDSGGNDYWESGIIRPDLVLKDLVNIFHQGKDSLYYYKRLR